MSLTDLVQLHEEVFRLLLVEEGLGGLAVRAVGFGKDDDGVLVDDLLCFGFGGHDGGGADAARGRAGEEAAEVGSYDGLRSCVCAMWIWDIAGRDRWWGCATGEVIIYGR